MNLNIKILDSRIGSEWPLPNYATVGSAGIDLVACLDNTYELCPNETLLVQTGIACQLNEAGYAMLILPRSSLGHTHKIIISNTPGLVDSDYRGQVLVSLWNRGNNSYVIQPGERIAQAIFVHIAQPQINVVSELDNTYRGSGGFGSSGRQ